jgi:hypothetical protein
MIVCFRFPLQFFSQIFFPQRTRTDCLESAKRKTAKWESKAAEGASKTTKWESKAAEGTSKTAKWESKATEGTSKTTKWESKAAEGTSKTTTKLIGKSWILILLNHLKSWRRSKCGLKMLVFHG